MSAAAIYARYSSDLQREASIEDQIRICRERAAKEGWSIYKEYSDSGISGASLIRPGIQKLLQDAQAGRFGIVVTESLDRLFRDQEDIAHIFKRISFAGGRIVTLSEGEINELHIGLKGTMGALYLKDLADKTRRGLRGRVEAGKSGGGNSYGYDVVRGLGPNGQPLTGERRINAQEAAIVRRIFEEYGAGVSPRAIAKRLNAESVLGPSGKAWGASTIHGNRRRGTGILNNELYIGRLVWNRLRYVKDPETGRRVSSPTARTGRAMFLTCCSPRSSKVTGNLSRTWSRTAREMHSPPGSHKLSSRAATLTPSPKMSPASLMMSPTLIPMRKVRRLSSATPLLR